MKKRSDERLDAMLTAYCEAAPEQSFTYDPDRAAQQREKVIPLTRYRRQLTAAAGFILVTVLSLTVYFLIGNKTSTPIAVAPTPIGATTPSAPNGGDGDHPQPADHTEPTEGKGLLEQIFGSLFPQPTEPDAAASSASPAEKQTKATEPGAAAPLVNPTEKQSKATQPAHVPPTTAVSPTSPVSPTTHAPTEPIPVSPTEPAHEPTTYVTPEETIPCDPPSNDDPEPTEGGSDEEPWKTVPEPVDFYGLFDPDLLPDDEVVYCKLYDDRGNLMGDSSLYASDRRAEIERVTENAVLVRYTTPEGMIWRSGFYNYVFYDANGRLLTQGQEYIEV